MRPLSCYDFLVTLPRVSPKNCGLSMDSLAKSLSRRCPECESALVRPSRQRRLLYDWPFRIAGLKPYRCLNCYVRFFQREANQPTPLRTVQNGPAKFSARVLLPWLTGSPARERAYALVSKVRASAGRITRRSTIPAD